MSRLGWKGALRAGTALGILIVATAQANAGAFAIREQSTYGQGTSFAGVAAGGSLSSMFWNPATMTQFNGIVSESGFSAIIPHVAQTPQTGSTLAGAPFFYQGVTNSGDNALVANGYTSYQVNPNLWLGLSINAPYGLSVSFQDPWAGRNYGLDTTIKTYNASPSIAYRINDWISIGVGAQLQYASIRYVTGLTPLPPSDVTLDGKGWGFGATAGVPLTPWAGTTIGLGYRSRIDQDIHGTLVLPTGVPGTPGSVDLTAIKLPDVVSLGIRHQFDSRWTVMGTAEWTNWSRIGTASVNQLNGAPALIGATPLTLPIQYRDGWFFSGGAEYRWTDRLTVRGGVGYEITPISDQVRTTRLPDNDKFWLSAGLSWKIAPFARMDLAYSHLFVKDTNVNITAASGNPSFNGTVNYIGTADSHADIFSASLVVQLDALMGVQPAKTLITK
jgi:long-chain fatty acid transport protein